MKDYIINVDVKKAVGTQTFVIHALSKEEAIELFNAGKGEFLCEEIEVTELYPVNIENIEE